MLIKHLFSYSHGHVCLIILLVYYLFYEFNRQGNIFLLYLKAINTSLTVNLTHFRAKIICQKQDNCHSQKLNISNLLWFLQIKMWKITYAYRKEWWKNVHK